LPRSFSSREEIEQASLFPRGNVTRWIRLDEAGRQIEIESAVAVPDLA
jgi:hypothetical protein